MRRLVVRLVLGLALCGSGLTFDPAPAQAQYNDPIGSFFRNLFGGLQRPPQRMAPPPQRRQYAPAPRRQRQSSGGEASRQQSAPERQAVAKDADAKRVAVFGDFFAAGLRVGLEDAFAESSNIVVEGRSEDSSGLVRRDHLDWPATIDAYLEDPEKKVDIAVVMIGGNDLQPLVHSGESYSPRTEAWRELYAARVDEILDLLHQNGTPVYWVGLPPAESERLNQHYAYFNDLYRERAYRAGAEFIDVWNGFVDENGNYASHGPDLNGENRQLRAEDGLHFTDSGNRKLAHFVSREIRRDIGRDGDLLVSMPRGPIGPQPYVGTERLAESGVGEVVTLTGGSAGSRALAGGPLPAPEPPSDSVYSRTILQGEVPEPEPGSSADFSWPRGTTGAEQAEPKRSSASARASGG